jgi:hypothetical protein
MASSRPLPNTNGLGPPVNGRDGTTAGVGGTGCSGRAIIVGSVAVPELSTALQWKDASGS